MASFETKIVQFLNAAVEHKVVERATGDRLAAFAQSEDYQHKGWFSLSAAMGGLGALVACIGIILLIATNWYLFNDPTKLTGFLTLLIGVHGAGVWLSYKGYGKMSATMHFLGAGLFIGGVGLIAQIFHLYSNKGESFLIWAAMIAPLAVLLRSGLITLLSLVALTIGGNMYLNYLHYDERMLVMADISLCVSITFVGFFMKHKGSEVGSFLQVPGILGVLYLMYMAGFAHHYDGYWSEAKSHMWLPIVVLLPAIFSAVLLWVRNKEDKAMRYFVLALGTAIPTVVLGIIMFTTDVRETPSFQMWEFGRTRTIYLIPFVVSVCAWIGYFAMTFWGVIYGALQHKRWMLNCNIILVGIGIFTRFIDLAGSMMDTGMMFVVCGLLLLAIGFALEKWRRKLIAQAR